MTAVNGIFSSNAQSAQIAREKQEITDNKKELNCFDKPNTIQCYIEDQKMQSLQAQEARLQEMTDGSVKHFDYNW